MDQFDINTQYKLYLALNKLSEKDMHPAERIERKRTFMAAWGQSLLLMRDEVAVLEEDKGVEILAAMLTQLQVFWMNECNFQ